MKLGTLSNRSRPVINPTNLALLLSALRCKADDDSCPAEPANCKQSKLMALTRLAVLLSTSCSLASIGQATEPPPAKEGVQIRLLLSPSHPDKDSKPVTRVAGIPINVPGPSRAGLPPIPSAEAPDPISLTPSNTKTAGETVLPKADEQQRQAVAFPLEGVTSERPRQDRSTSAQAENRSDPLAQSAASAIAQGLDKLATQPNTPSQGGAQLSLQASSGDGPSETQGYGRNLEALRPVQNSRTGEPAPLPPINAQSSASHSVSNGSEGALDYGEPQALTTDSVQPLKLSAQSQAEQSPDSAAECPGSPEGNADTLQVQPDDIPLEQDDHPYDAPSARQENSRPIERRAAIRQTEKQHTARELLIAQRINSCLDYFISNPENVVRRGPWALMHATLPFGVETEIVAGSKRVNAIGWMCFNGVCAKQRMFQPTRTGFRTNLGPGVQGHEGQFLAILAQSQVSSTYPLQIGQRRYSVQDLVNYEMATCREKSELTFKLIGLSHYLPGEQRWRDSRGHTWNLEKMVAEELAQPVIGAAWGGTHRLMGLSYATVQRQRQGLPSTGHWVRAEKFLNDYINYAMKLQNPDGSFSTEWFEGRGMDRDVEKRVQTTGHILEWLIYSLPEEHLHSDRIQKSVEFLLDSIGRKPSHDWPIGPRGHALRALVLYNQRVFDVEVGKMTEHVAAQRSQFINR